MPMTLAGAGSTLIVGSMSTYVIGTFITPILEEQAARRTSHIYGLQLDSWRRNPDIPPPPSVLLDCWNRGFISEELAGQVLRNQGVNVSHDFDTPRLNNHRIAWMAAKRAMLNRPSTQFVMDCWARGFFDDDPEEARLAIVRSGGDWQALRGYRQTLWNVPAVGDLIEARNRDLITGPQFITWLKRHGFGGVESRNVYHQLRRRLPGPSDVVHFAVKEAFSPDVANPLKLYDEFPQAIMPFMKGHGLAWETDMDIVANGVERKATIADLHWASHWTPISPQQIIGMFHILRPNRLQRYRAAGVNVTAVDMMDVQRWLRVNDYPPTVRDNLAALSFTPLRLVDIRSALTLNWRLANEPGFAAGMPAAMQARIRPWNRAWGIEQFRDRGVLPEDANTQVDLVYSAAAARLFAPAQAASRTAVRKAVNVILQIYHAGISDRQVARNGLLTLGITAAAADVFLDIEDARIRMEDTAAMIRGTRRGLMSGAITEIDARSRLVQAGMRPDYVQTIVDRWLTELLDNRRHATTERIQRWVAEGRMTPEEGRRRLTNLGWNDADLVLLIQEAQGRALILRARAIRAADSDNRRRMAQLDKVRRDQIAALEKTQQAIRRQTPVSKLQAAVRKGIITRDQFMRRMLAMGYLPDAARLHLEDALRPNPQAIYPAPPEGTTTRGTVTLDEPPPPPLAQPPQPPPQPAPPPQPQGQQVLNVQPQILNVQPEALRVQPQQFGQGEPPP